MCSPTVAEQELQMGHKNFPLGDTATLRQRKSDAVDVFLEGSSGRSTSPREERREAHYLNQHGKCSPGPLSSGTGAASPALNKTFHIIQGKDF